MVKRDGIGGYFEHTRQWRPVAQSPPGSAKSARATVRVPMTRRGRARALPSGSV